MDFPIFADSFVVVEWRDPGGPAEAAPRLIAPLHVHYHDDEAWYVLDGVLVPRGTPHTYWNPGPDHDGNIYKLIEDIHALSERTPETLQAVFR